jgi:outer membrane protein TolC
MNVLMAENQAQPELNVKLDAKQSFLADEYIPFRDLYGQNNPYHSWRAGFEFRRGLQGNITEQKQLEAAQLRETQAELTMNAFRQRIASEMNGIKGILERANDQVRQQSKMVDAYWDLFKAEEQRAQSGQSSRVEVLNRELAYYIAKEGQRDAIAQQNLSSYLASQISGTLLTRMGIE